MEFQHCGTLLVTLAEIWHFQYADEVAKTFFAIEAFLGVVLKIASVLYNKKQEQLEEVKAINGQN